MNRRLPSGDMNTEAPQFRPTDWYVDHLLADANRFAAVLDAGPTDAPVAACPGWDVSRLAEHLGRIHRWARFCAAHGSPPTPADGEPPHLDSAESASAWLQTGAEELAATLRSIEPDAPTWHPFPVEQIGRVWPRRQAHETAIHRWDAEQAVGASTGIDPELAADGIDEYFEIALPRLKVRETLELPAGSLHVHCTDVPGEWLVWADDDGVLQVVRAHRRGDAALRGPASEILLRLWGRASEHADQLEPIGDERVIAAWLGLSGM